MTEQHGTTVLPDPSTTEAVLAAAAGAARYAPSIHNTQPWRWTKPGPTLELTARPDRQLRSSDPSSRMLTISCGASLAYARAAVSAQGWRPVVTRLPEPNDHKVLARLGVGERIPDNQPETERFRTLMRRQTDRRPLRAPAATPEEIETIRQAAEQEDCHLQPLRRSQVIRLAAAADTARRLESADPDRQRELAEWVAVNDDDSGIPDTVIPTAGGRYLVPPRFHTGSLAINDSGGDEAAVYLLLFTDNDDPLAWLRGGEALVGAWAAANDAGLAVMPLSSVVEMAAARLGLYRILTGIGHPLLILRVGHPDTTVEPPLTSREKAASAP